MPRSHGTEKCAHLVDTARTNPSCSAVLMALTARRAVAGRRVNLMLIDVIVFLAANSRGGLHQFMPNRALVAPNVAKYCWIIFHIARRAQALSNLLRY